MTTIRGRGRTLEIAIDRALPTATAEIRHNSRSVRRFFAAAGRSCTSGSSKPISRVWSRCGKIGGDARLSTKRGTPVENTVFLWEPCGDRRALRCAIGNAARETEAHE